MKKCIDCGKELRGHNNPKRCNSCAHKGILSYKYIDGRSLKNYYCIACGIKIKWQTAVHGFGKCRSCGQKERNKIQTNTPNFKHGKCCIKTFCIDCGKLLGKNSGFKNSIRCRSCCRKGKLNPNYINGIGRLPYTAEFSDELKNKIRDRDNRTCQLCKIIESNYFRKLDIHHIDYNKENCKDENLISLCVKCNTKANGNRDYWFAFFTYIMENYICS